jgi:hypothetical protein
MRNVECQGKSFVTTDDVMNAVSNFFSAAQRHGRTVRIVVPIVPDEQGTSEVELILFPGEPIVIADSDVPDMDLDTEPLIRSLTDRAQSWFRPRR